jgi:C4-dicarboxylate-specific signal transduction histidine kinase
MQIVADLKLDYDEGRGPDSEDWLGVPMVSNSEVVGAIVVQSYDKARRYSDSDRALLTYVAQHILTALMRRRAQEELEAQVGARTHELAAANRQLGSANDELKQEVAERKTAERLQAALFRIAELTSTASSMYEFFAAVHGVVGELLYAKNFFIVLLVEDGAMFDFPYAVDEHDSGTFFQRRPLRRGLTEYLLRSGKPLLASREQIDQLAAAGEMQTLGSPSVCWLGVPLMQHDVAFGAIVVQSYSQQVIYTTRDQELLTFVAFHIAAALQRRRAQDSLKVAYAELERRVEELHRAQNELIEIEKMASLGRLVAGVAHEVNTPLGIGVTAISFLRGQLASLRAALPADQLESLLAPVEAAAEMAEVNLNRAANLVRTFKQVAVDQSTSHIRTVPVREYLEGTLLSLSPIIRKGGHRVDLQCEPGIQLTSRPDALHQIIVNLVMNSIAHAFPDGAIGTLTIKVEEENSRLHVRYRDDGIGMDAEVSSHMFEPFYTTRRDQGGTGLGMHIVYNLVTQALGGKISCETRPGAGVRFDMVFPSVHPQGGFKQR